MTFIAYHLLHYRRHASYITPKALMWGTSNKFLIALVSSSLVSGLRMTRIKV
jgi:hypothetical protein